jgi:DNA-binding NarL/FixJ family response regulator
VILAAVDDLLFSSKIRGVAKHAGVEVRFVRAPGAVLDAVREHRPTLLVLDLDAARLEPVAVLEALRAEPPDARPRTVGFVSHVHAEVIEAARSAGADLVLARSAFVAALPELVAGAR